MKKRFVLLVLACAGALAVTAPAFAATIRVDDDRAQCSNAAFTSIQAAVTAAAPGTRIEVCPGTYQEQVTVPAGKNNLDIYSRNSRAAVIKAPPVMAEPGDIVRINGARNVLLRDFVITGPLPDTLFCSLAVRSGVRVDGGGTAGLVRNHITEIRAANAALRGCQNGIAVVIGRQSEGQTGQAALIGNRIDSYQKGGVLVDGAGSRAAIEGNVIQGEGPTPTIAQNGVQISRGAVVHASRNTVSDNTYSLAPASGSAGFLLFAAGAGTVVERNLVQRNDDNISVSATSGVEISRNQVLDSTFFDGIFLDADSTDNRIERNTARGNAEHDCHDSSAGGGTAGTANRWDRNTGATENRPGLCDDRKADDDD